MYLQFIVVTINIVYQVYKFSQVPVLFLNLFGKYAGRIMSAVIFFQLVERSCIFPAEYEANPCYLVLGMSLE